MTYPNFLRFCAVPKFLEATGEGTTPTFNMVAYTGGKMRVDGFPHPVVVDLKGLDIPSQSIPIRLDHKSEQGVGHTMKINIEKSELTAEGLISRDTKFARDVAESGTKGFPWQASIGGPILEAEFVSHGNFADVNGQKIEGPVHIVRKMTLKEISFVDNAADSNTSATVNAHSSEAGDKESGDFASNRSMIFDDTPDYSLQTLTSNLNQQIRAAALAETNRIEGIRKIADGKQSELVARAVAEGWEVPRFELEFLRKSRPVDSGVRQERNNPTTQVLEAVAMQSGGLSLRAMEKQYDEPVLEAADK